MSQLNAFVDLGCICQDSEGALLSVLTDPGTLPGTLLQN